MLNPDVGISLALVTCLSTCFKMTHMMNNYEEVIGAVDRIIATYSPGNILTVMEKQAMHFILTLLVSWLQLFSGPDCLEDAIHHICTFVPCLPDEDHTMFANVLDSLIKQCFDYFGVTGKLEGIPPPWTNPHYNRHAIFFLGSKAVSQMDGIKGYLTEATIVIANGKIMDVDATVEHSQKLLPLQQSSNQWSSSSMITGMFVGLLFAAYHCMKRLNHLNEAISMLRYAHNVSAKMGTWSHFTWGLVFWDSLIACLQSFPNLEDFKELM